MATHKSRSKTATAGKPVDPAKVLRITKVTPSAMNGRQAVRDENGDHMRVRLVAYRDEPVIVMARSTGRPTACHEEVRNVILNLKDDRMFYLDLMGRQRGEVSDELKAKVLQLVKEST